MKAGCWVSWQQKHSKVVWKKAAKESIATLIGKEAIVGTQKMKWKAIHIYEPQEVYLIQDLIHSNNMFWKTSPLLITREASTGRKRSIKWMRQYRLKILIVGRFSIKFSNHRLLLTPITSCNRICFSIKRNGFWKMFISALPLHF